MCESKSLKEGREEENWIGAMQEETDQFERNEVCGLVFGSKNYNVIGTKWVFRNKLDENGKLRNRVCLVAQEHYQEKRLIMKELFLLYLVYNP